MKLSEMQMGFGSTWWGLDKPKMLAGKKAGEYFRRQLRTRFSPGYETFNGVEIQDDDSLPDDLIRFVATGNGSHAGETYDVVIEEEKNG